MQMNHQILDSVQAVAILVKEGDIGAFRDSSSVKDVIPISENGLTIGYVISFVHGDPITIYNGKNGENGHTPIIGVKKDDDGVWYWTIDDNWLLNEDGERVCANGQVPKLKIEDDYWWVSYDNGLTWSKLGKALSESGGLYWEYV